VWQFALLIDMGIDEEAQFMNGLLGLSGESASQCDDMFVNIVDFVRDSIDSVDSSG
jgi:hypothetical protein